MRLRFDIELGPLRITFDPWPEADDDELLEDADADPEPAIQGMGSVESQVLHREDARPPELHVGFGRNGYYEE